MNRIWAKRLSASPAYISLAFATAALAAGYVSAAGDGDHSTVRPVVACEALAKADVSRPAGTAVRDLTAASIEIAKGPFCQVKGVFDTDNHFEVDLPIDHWTQRFVEPGCGGDCGLVRATISNGHTCEPALNGEFVVAANDLGHQGGKSYPGGSWAKDPLMRMDMAYRGNHVTAVVAKELIQQFYKREPRYSYFVGCSDGGREALVEAERYPEDFDGISAGAPVMLFSIQNSIAKLWESQANLRADGTKILYKGRAAILHDAVVAHCPTLSGVKDGLLEDPRACKFDPSWVQCKPGETDTTRCLTQEEVGVALKLYAGASDASGHLLTLSTWPLGSELSWQLPNSGAQSGLGGPGGPGGPGQGQPRGPNSMMKYMIPLSPLPDDDPMLKGAFGFDQASFDFAAQSAPFWGGANTNLRSFQGRGGKLIMWHGLADTSVAPWVSIAYYEAVQKEMGTAAADRFVRLFLIPGVGHCGGGDGFQQVDLLSPLMAWTERKQEPSRLVGNRVAGRAGGGPGGPGGGPGGPGGPGGSAAPVEAKPYAAAPQPALSSRAIFPYPFVARYTGTGDPNDATNYRPAKTPVPVPQVFNTEASRLIGPNNQKVYRVVGDALLPNTKQ